jgi:shikimate kinase
LVKAEAISVWLKAEVDVLLERVSRRSNRPLLKTANPRATLEKLIEDRYPIYAEADVTVVSRDVPEEVVTDDVVDAIFAYLQRQG